MKSNVLKISAFEIKRDGGFLSRFTIRVEDNHAKKDYGDFDDMPSLMGWAGSKLDMLKKVSDENDFDWSFFIEEGKVYCTDKCDDIVFAGFPD